MALQGGVYELEDFIVKKKGVVIFDEPVEIHAQKRVSFGKNSAFGPTIATLDAKSAVFHTEGNFDAGKRSLINANIIAPLGTVEFGKSSRLNGFAFGRRVVFKRGAVADLENFFRKSTIVTPP